MAFCGKCGAQVPDGTPFCGSCGAPMNAEAQQPVQPTAQPVADDKKDANDNKVMGILAYLGWLVLVPLFAAKDSKFARFHANQGLILVIIYCVIYILAAILGAVGTAIAIAAYSSALMTIFSIITTILYIGASAIALIGMIIGIMNACKGECKELPVIGKFKILK